MEFITSFGGESDSGAKSSGNEGDNDGKKKKVRHILSNMYLKKVKCLVANSIVDYRLKPSHG